MPEGVILSENKYISVIDFYSAKTDREQPVDLSIADGAFVSHGELIRTAE